MLAPTTKLHSRAHVRTWEGAEDGSAWSDRIQPSDGAARQLLVGAAARQDGDFGALVVVLGSRLRSKAPDHDAAAAIAGYREVLSAARQFENTPAAVVKEQDDADPTQEQIREGHRVDGAQADRRIENGEQDVERYEDCERGRYRLHSEGLRGELMREAVARISGEE